MIEGPEDTLTVTLSNFVQVVLELVTVTKNFVVEVNALASGLAMLEALRLPTGDQL